jgi:hypothetical protein
MLSGLVSTWSPPLVRTTAPTLVPLPISTPPPWINHASTPSPRRGCRAQGRALRPCCLSRSSITAPRRGHTRPASACIHAPRRGQHFDPYRSSRPLQDLFERLKSCRSGTHAYAPQKGDIEVGVNTAVEVSTGRRDAPFSLKEAKVLRCYSKLPCGLADMPCSAVHIEGQHRCRGVPCRPKTERKLKFRGEARGAERAARSADPYP